MIKKIFLILILLALTAAAAVYYAGSNALNKGVKSGVEKYGPKVTQTSVRLDEVKLSFLSGSGTLKGLYVGNPEGFNSEHIFALGQIEIQVDPGSVFSDPIIIKKIHIRQPEISYEKKLNSSNVKELMKNIAKFTGRASSEKSPQEPNSGAKKQLVIKELLIEDGTIYVDALGIGQTIELPRIEMYDIGEGGNTTSIADVLDLVLGEVVKSIGPAVGDIGKLVEGGGKALLDSAKEQAVEKVGAAAKDSVNKASEGLKSLFGN